MLKILASKYIHDETKLDAVVEVLFDFYQTDVGFPGRSEQVRNRLTELDELEVLKEFEKGTFRM